MRLPKLTPNDDRGQVGIGTLIIFIALVLVAAVAAGVLIETSGQLQAQASDTGEDAQSEISNQIQVVSASGSVSTAGQISEINLVVKQSPGAEPLDLTKMTIAYESGNASDTLTYSATGATAGDTFTTTDIAGTTSGEVLNANSDRVEVTITPPSNLVEGSSVTLQLTDQSGATTIYGVNVPDVITSENYVQL